MGKSEFEADEMFGYVKDQAAMGARRPGSPAGKANEEYLEKHLKDLGYENVRAEPIPVAYWRPEETSLEVVVEGGAKPVDAFPVAFAAFTGADGVEAPLVYAKPKAIFGRRAWRGAIVVTEIGFPPLNISQLAGFGLGSHDPDGSMLEVKHPATWVRLGWHLYRKAAKAGAAGFVGIVRDQPGGMCDMFAPYGFKEKDILDKPLPGVWVGRKDGARLLECAQSGTGRARLTTTGTRTPAVTHNIVGELPGKNDAEVVVVHSHHDSPFESPVEDATGVSVVLALAKHFAARRDLKRRLVVLFTAGHFYGSIGTREFLRRHKDDIVAKTAVEISVEHVAREAVEDESGRLAPSGRPEVTGIFIPPNREVAKAVLGCLEANELNRVLLLPAEGPLGDYPPTDGGDWYEAGVPVVNHISNPVYLLTGSDGLEWVDRERLPRVAGCFADLVRTFDTMTRSAIRPRGAWLYRLKMKLIKRIARVKTTFFGLRPVY
jgi:hypothetical protein